MKSFPHFEKIKNYPTDFITFYVLCFVQTAKYISCVYRTCHLMREGPHKSIGPQAICISTRKKWMQTFFVRHRQLVWEKFLKKTGVVRKILIQFYFCCYSFCWFYVISWKSFVPCYRWAFSFDNFPRVFTYISVWQFED